MENTILFIPNRYLHELTTATISAAVPLEHLIIGTAPVLTIDVSNALSS